MNRLQLLIIATMGMLLSALPASAAQSFSIVLHHSNVLCNGPTDGITPGVAPPPGSLANSQCWLNQSPFTQSGTYQLFNQDGSLASVEIKFVGPDEVDAEITAPDEIANGDWCFYMADQQQSSGGDWLGGAWYGTFNVSRGGTMTTTGGTTGTTTGGTTGTTGGTTGATTTGGTTGTTTGGTTGTTTTGGGGPCTEQPDPATKALGGPTPCDYQAAAKGSGQQSAPVLLSILPWLIVIAAIYAAKTYFERKMSDSKTSSHSGGKSRRRSGFAAVETTTHVTRDDPW